VPDEFLRVARTQVGNWSVQTMCRLAVASDASAWQMFSAPNTGPSFSTSTGSLSAGLPA
jgi:hypothetical protein